MRPSLTISAYLCRSQVENFGRLRYERSRDALEHGRILTQRHEATDAELAMAEGDRPLVSHHNGFLPDDRMLVQPVTAGCALYNMRAALEWESVEGFAL